MNKDFKKYAETLKLFKGKRGTLPILRGVASSGDKLYATNLGEYAEFSATVPEGVYDEFGFDMLASQGETAQVVKTADLVDFPELPKFSPEFSATLSPLDIDHLLEAVDYVSKDTTRPALGIVAIMDGLIVASDGYIMYATRQELGFKDGVFAHLSPLMLQALKKLRKLGVWELSVSSEGYVKLSNGTFSMVCELRGAFPDVRQLLDSGKTFDSCIVFDYEKVSALADKTRDRISIDKETGEVLLENNNTGVVARINKTETTRDLFADTRKVIMPLIGDPNLIELDYSLLKKLNKKNKSITLLTNLVKGGMIEVL